MHQNANLRHRFLVWLPWVVVALAIAFNLILLRAESTVQSDPNDNIFQFALVNRTGVIWETYGCPTNVTSCWPRLFDHWTPEWGDGYPLPFYYSHLPQIAIVASYHLLLSPLLALFSQSVSLFIYYHWLVYLAMCLFPLSVMLALRVMKLSPLTQIFGAIIASHISTDGLYGLDQSSYLWRGYGLSSQLFASLFLPLAYACTYQIVIGGSKKYLPAIVFLVLTLSSHFGIGYIAILSFLPFFAAALKKQEIVVCAKKLAVIVGGSVALLSYWIVPFLLYSNFNAVSFWDPVWKFNSFGAGHILIKFFEGDLADFGRLPMISILLVIGFFVILLSKQHKPKDAPATLLPVALLFPFWLILFFGRTTLGSLIDLLPGTTGFHLHRFIIGLHLSVLFLAPVGASWLAELFGRVLTRMASLYGQNDKNRQTLVSAMPYVGKGLILLLLIIFIYPQTIAYAKPNSAWIANANESFDKDWPDFARVLSTISNSSPGRIYAGKAGYWGKDQNVGSTKVYMAISAAGHAVGQFMPQTWSPNSDTEQFFDDRVPQHYDLYNFRYTVAPESVTVPAFLKKISNFGKYYLYETESSGHFTIGKSNLGVLANRTNYQNLVHLWLQSPLVGARIFPVLVFAKDRLPESINTITMIDQTTYSPNGQKSKEISLFDQSPLGQPTNYATPSATFSNEKVTGGQEYGVTADIATDCADCFVVFKSTYHPNWQALVNGKPRETIIVFPFFVGIPLEPGRHEIRVIYQPTRGKMMLLGLTFIVVTLTLFVRMKNSREKFFSLVKKIANPSKYDNQIKKNSHEK